MGGNGHRKQLLSKPLTSLPLLVMNYHSSHHYQITTPPIRSGNGMVMETVSGLRETPETKLSKTKESAGLECFQNQEQFTTRKQIVGEA